MTEMTDTTATPRGERTREATDRKLMRATLQIAVDRGISGPALRCGQNHDLPPIS